MSLINDALKKAQKQRTGDSPPLASMPSVGGESPARIAKRDKPAGINTQLVRLGVAGGAVVLVLVVGGIFLIRSFRSAPVTATPPASTPVATVHTETPASSEAGRVTPVVAPKSGDGGSAEPTVSFRLPAAPPVEREPVTATAAPAMASAERAASSPEAGRDVAKAVPSEPAAPAVPPPKMDAKSLDYIDNLRIAGIRAAGADSKVLMNDRVFRIGDMVDRDLGLKLTGITANSLTFVDPNGASYTRQF